MESNTSVWWPWEPAPSVRGSCDHRRACTRLLRYPACGSFQRYRSGPPAMTPACRYVWSWPRSVRTEHACGTWRFICPWDRSCVTVYSTLALLRRWWCRRRNHVIYLRQSPAVAEERWRDESISVGSRDEVDCTVELGYNRSSSTCLEYGMNK